MELDQSGAKKKRPPASRIINRGLTTLVSEGLQTTAVSQQSMPGLNSVAGMSGLADQSVQLGAGVQVGMGVDVGLGDGVDVAVGGMGV